MWLFNTKKEKNENISQEVIEKPRECQHQWFDFDWYMESDWHSYQNSSRGEFTIEIIEPYVCCLCKKREDHVLHKVRMYNVTEEDFKTTRAELKEEYKNYITSRAIVEDKIRDMQKNIDHEFMKLFSDYFPAKVGTPKQEKIVLKLAPQTRRK